MGEQAALSFAGLLRQLRHEAGLTQEELAEAATLSPRSVSDLERGINRTARKDTALLLARALRLAGPVAELFAAAALGRVPAAEVLAVRGGAPPGTFAARGAEAAAGVVPRQLPAGATFFAGREAELKELDALLDQAGPDGGGHWDGGTGGAVVISAVAGMAGVGKTALAVHWARRVAGRFPDGQLYVNLRGYDPESAAVAPAEAAGWFLAALGVPAAQIPVSLAERAGLYRSVLAGRRVLIVLDNAAGAAQVRPLLPGSPGCLVIVTSRSALAGLAAAEGARLLRLGPLGAEEAARLLAVRLGPERVAAEPGAVTELGARCGHLPLALAVMAARAAADPGLPLQVLAGELAEAADAEGAAAGPPPGGESPGRLEVLETGDPATSLRELLSWSHRQLSPSADAMLALVGVHCGPDITVPAAASMAAVPRPDARRALAELAGASLAAEHRPGRYVMHDLVRGYAAWHARHDVGETGIREAIGRSLDHYLHTLYAGTIWSNSPLPFPVAPPASGVVPERFADEPGALRWTRAEHQVLLQAPVQAAAAGLLTRAWQLFAFLAFELGGQGFWADWRTAGHMVLGAAETAGDHVALGWTHTMLGWYGMFTGAPDEDRGHLAQALDAFRRAGDLTSQSRVHFASCQVGLYDGAWTEAAAHAEQALALSRQAGDRLGEGWALAGLGSSHAFLGNCELARGYARQALAVAPEADDPMLPAFARSALGLVHARLGEHSQAMSCYQQALDVAVQRKNPLDRWWLATLLIGFGRVCRAAGDLPAAAAAWQEALQIFDELGVPADLPVRASLKQAVARALSG